MLAGIIAAPLSGGQRTGDDTMSVKDATVLVIIMAIIFTPFALSFIMDLFFCDNEIIPGCIVSALLVMMWLCVFFQVRKYNRSKDKDNKQ